MDHSTSPTAPTPPLDPASLDLLRVVSEGLVRVVGFGVAVISVVDGDDLVVVAVSGDLTADDGTGTVRSVQDLLHDRFPLARLHRSLEVAEDWGAFKFVPHAERQLLEHQGWRSARPPVDHPDAWRQLDALLAPIHDADGDLRGLISVWLPDDGLRPGPPKRRLMDKYAAQAGQAVLAALERGELAERVRVLEAARTTIRNVSSNLDLDVLLGETHDALRTGFSADGMWIHTNAPDAGDAAVAGDRTEPPRFSVELIALMEHSARYFWDLQQVDVATPATLRVDPRFGEDGAWLAGLCEQNGIGSVLFVPLGAGTTCVGCLVLVRNHGRRPWSAAEREVALGLGHDLGRAIDNARSYGRERRLVEKLQELASYKSGVINSLASELSTPIAQMLHAVHRLADVLDGSGAAPRPEVVAARRSAERMVRVVEDLTVLAQVGNPHTPLRRVDVDLVLLAEGVLDLVRPSAEERGLSVTLERPVAPVVVPADPTELEQVVENLVVNAVKYTPRGGRVSVRFAEPGDGEVAIEVADTGIGIAPGDLTRLFEAFYRAPAPEVRAITGTGLGLAIVDRIVERHHGRTEVVSTPGAGSTFRVLLPREVAQ